MKLNWIRNRSLDWECYETVVQGRTFNIERLNADSCWIITDGFWRLATASTLEAAKYHVEAYVQGSLLLHGASTAS